MASFSMRLPLGAPPTEYFREIPNSAKRFLNAGFKVLTRLEPTYSAPLVSLVTESISAGAEPDPAMIKDKFGLDERESNHLVGALSFLVLILSAPAAQQEPVQQVVEGLVSAEILDANAAQSLIALVSQLQLDKAKIAAGFKRSAVASRLLPSLTDLELQVELRLEFEKDRIVLAVPVLLVHVDTDAAHQELWLQMSKAQVQRAVEDMKKALFEMEAAENWARRG